MNRNRIITIITIIIYMLFSFNNLSNDFILLKKQIIWYAVSFIGFFLFLKIDNNKIYKGSIIFYLILNILLLYLLIKGSVINGSKAWIKIGSFSLQPSEFMKLDLIILLNYIAFYNFNIYKLIILTLIPSILTFLEPDTGNVIFYLIILLIIIFFYKRKLGYIIMGITMFSIITVILLYKFEPSILIKIFKENIFYRMDRLFNMNNYQLKRSLISIGSTNFYKGNNNIISIPFSTSDFAFALLTTKCGFIFTTIYLINNIICNINILNISDKKVGVIKQITITFLFMKIIQETINIFMTLGLMPITGITLPFISYGGSSLIVYFILLGIINSKDYNMMDMDYKQLV